MSELFGCDPDLMYEISQLEEVNSLPNYSGGDLTDTTMGYASSEQTTNSSTYNNVPVHHWTSQNSVEWAEKICYQNSLDTFSVDIGALSNTNGGHLVQLSLEDVCLMLGEYYGQLFYEELQKLKGTHQVVSGESPDYFSSSPDLDPTSSVNYDYNQEFYGSNVNMDSGNQEQFMCSPYTDNSNLYSYSESYDSYGATNSNLSDPLNDKYDDCFNLDNSLNDVDFNFDEDSLENIQLYDLDSKLSLGALSVDMGELQLNNNPDGQNDYTNITSHISSQTEKKPRKKKIRKDVVVSNNTVQELCKMVPGSGKYIRCPKSWEFLMRLLVNSETNPEVICWEDEAEYIFRLVDPRKIIELWSAKAGKSSGNYDNFARSLRYHYKKGILVQVPEKQHVYRCGPLAIEYLHQLQTQG